ncbi:MAG: TonB-dependent receptor, partial [Bacteroidota bacterium]
MNHYFFLFLLLCLFPAFSNAQETPALSTTGEEILVTGARYARSAEDSPQRVTIIDSATVAQAADLSQLLHEQAGIVINGAYSNPGKDRSVFLRNGANQFTLILVDGQPLIDPSSLGGAVDLRLLSLAGIERIEILRGGRSLLYGSDAVAGVINLITVKDQRPQKPTVHLRTAAQSYNTLEAQAAITGSTQKLDYRIGYNFFDTDGISEAVRPDTVTTEFGEDGATRRTLDAALTYRPSQHLSIRPTLRVASFDGDYDAGSFQDGDNSYTNELLLPSLAVDYQKDRLALGLRANYAKTDRDFATPFFTSEFRGRAHQEELFAVYRPTELATLTVGTQLRNERLLGSGPDEMTLDATTFSPYGLLNLTAAEDFLLEAGLRYNQHSEFGGQLNWSLALGTNTTEEWSSRLNIGSSFQSPTLDQLAGPFGPNADLQPQTSLSVELSTQLADPAGDYRLALALFQRTIDQQINYLTSDAFPFGRYENSGEVRDRGVELSGFVRLGERFRLDGNLTYVRGKQTAADGTETEEFFRRPRATSSAGWTYTAKRRFLARLTSSYVGERPDVWFDASFSRFTTELAPYVLVNFYAEYRFLPAEN